MRVGVFFDGFSSTGEMIEVARAAEAAGAQSLWFAQHMGYRDALVWAAAAAGATRRARLVPTAISPYLWPPLPVAMAAASLDELAPGRAVLCVSVGNLLNLAESGIEPAKPLRVTREYIAALRTLFTGEAVRQEGLIHALRGAHMEFRPSAPIPIYVASTGPRMLHLAGAIGDGVLLSAGLTLQSCRRCIERAAAGAREAGRAAGSVSMAGFVNLAVARDGKAARRAMLRRIAFLFRSKGHAENIASAGLEIDHASIIASLARRDLDGAARLLPEEAATSFGVAGTPEECQARLEAYLSVGLDEPIVEIVGGEEERRLALEVVRRVAAR